MNKKNITITASIILAVIIVILLVLFNTKHTVKFDTKGGSEVTSQEVKFMRKIDKPESPTKEGFVFDNWYYDNAIFDFDTKITKDMTIEARWIEEGNEGTYTITFDTNGGNEIKKLSVKKDGTITKPSDPTREGYKFIGWEYQGEPWDFTNPVKENMTLVATWKKIEDGENVKVESIKVSNTSITLKVGATKKITATITPKNASNTTITWTSSNTKVATVDKSGNIKGIKEGTATITATIDGAKATVKVTVTGTSTVSVTGVNVNKTKVTLKVGSIETIIATVSPTNATNKSVSWTSSNNAIATVDSNGLITAVGKGTATITVTTADGNKTATIEVKVEDAYTVTLKANYTGNKISGYSYKVYKNGVDTTDYKGFTCGAYSVTPSSGQLNADATETNCTIKIDGATYDLIATYEK